MNISKEKEYLYGMIADLVADRRKTTDMILELKSRLNDLNRLELRGLEDLSVKGYVDLHNARDVKRMTTNIERETAGIIRKIEKEREVVTEDVFSEPKSSVEEDVFETSSEAKNTNTVTSPVSTRVYNKTNVTSLDKAAGIIAHILKEHELPMKSKALYELVNSRLDSPIKRANFSNNVLPRASKLNPKINNVSHGYWQYLNN